MGEQKLKSKFPAIGGRPLGGGGHSAFLQKRLGKGQKYFDSGDYQMAKQGGRLGRTTMPVLAQPTGEAHPTPDSVPARKSSIIQGVAGQGGPGQIGARMLASLCPTQPWQDYYDCNLCDQKCVTTTELKNHVNCRHFACPCLRLIFMVKKLI